MQSFGGGLTSGAGGLSGIGGPLPTTSDFFSSDSFRPITTNENRGLSPPSNVERNRSQASNVIDLQNAQPFGNSTLTPVTGPQFSN